MSSNSPAGRPDNNQMERQQHNVIAPRYKPTFSEEHSSMGEDKMELQQNSVNFAFPATNDYFEEKLSFLSENRVHKIYRKFGKFQKQQNGLRRDSLVTQIEKQQNNYKRRSRILPLQKQQNGSRSDNKRSPKYSNFYEMHSPRSPEFKGQNSDCYKQMPSDIVSQRESIQSPLIKEIMIEYNNKDKDPPHQDRITSPRGSHLRFVLNKKELKNSTSQPSLSQASKLFHKPQHEFKTGSDNCILPFELQQLEEPSKIGRKDSEQNLELHINSVLANNNTNVSSPQASIKLQQEQADRERELSLMREKVKSLLLDNSSMKKLIQDLKQEMTSWIKYINMQIADLLGAIQRQSKANFDTLSNKNAKTITTPNKIKQLKPVQLEKCFQGDDEAMEKVMGSPVNRIVGKIIRNTPKCEQGSDIHVQKYFKRESKPNAPAEGKGIKHQQDDETTNLLLLNRSFDDAICRLKIKQSNFRSEAEDGPAQAPKKIKKTSRDLIMNLKNLNLYRDEFISGAEQDSCAMQNCTSQRAQRSSIRLFTKTTAEGSPLSRGNLLARRRPFKCDEEFKSMKSIEDIRSEATISRQQFKQCYLNMQKLVSQIKHNYG